MADLHFHEFANIFPLIDGPEFERLVADIQANGLREDITLHEGKILDGRNRYRACLRAKVEPRFRDYAGDDSPDGLLAFVVSVNVARRQLSKEDLALCAAEADDLLAKLKQEGQEAMQAGAQKGGQTAGRGRHKDSPVEKVAQGNEPKQRAPTSRAKMAGMMGVNEGYVGQAVSLKRSAPALYAEVKAHKKKLTEATAEAKRAGLLEAAKPKAKPPEDDRSKTIWVHKAWDTGGADHKWAEHVGGLLLGEMANRDCHLYLECDGGDSIVRAVALVERWKEHGFRLVQALTLKNQTAKAGGHFRDSTAPVLFLVRGKLDLLKPGVEPFLDGTRFHKQVETLSPGPRLEVFATEKRPGWRQPGDLA